MTSVPLQEPNDVSPFVGMVLHRQVKVSRQADCAGLLGFGPLAPRCATTLAAGKTPIRRPTEPAPHLMRGWSGLRLGRFFEFGKAPIPPVLDCVLIPLGGTQHRLLSAPAAAPQYPSHPCSGQGPALGRVVGHAKFPLNYLRHSPSRPDFPAEPEGGRPSGQQLRDLPPLPVVQLGLPARMLAAAQGWDTSLAGFADPLADRAPSDAQGRSHVLLLPALLHQLPGPEPAGFLPIGRRFISRNVHEVDYLTDPTLSLGNRSRISSTPICLTVGESVLRQWRFLKATL